MSPPPPQTIIRVEGRNSSVEGIRRADLLGHALVDGALYSVRFGGRARTGVIVVVVVFLFPSCSLIDDTPRPKPNPVGEQGIGMGMDWQAISASASFAQFTPSRSRTPAMGHRAVCMRLPDRVAISA